MPLLWRFCPPEMPRLGSPISRTNSATLNISPNSNRLGVRTTSGVIKDLAQRLASRRWLLERVPGGGRPISGPPDSAPVPTQTSRAPSQRAGAFFQAQPHNARSPVPLGRNARRQPRRLIRLGRHALLLVQAKGRSTPVMSLCRRRVPMRRCRYDVFPDVGASPHEPRRRIGGEDSRTRRFGHCRDVGARTWRRWQAIR
jgi:hypothetical protein